MFTGRWWPFPSSWHCCVCDVCNMLSLCLQVAGGPFPHPGTAVCDVCNMVSLCLQVTGGAVPHPDTAVCVMCVIWCHCVYRSLVALSLILALLCV